MFTLVSLDMFDSVFSLYLALTMLH